MTFIRESPPSPKIILTHPDREEVEGTILGVFTTQEKHSFSNYYLVKIKKTGKFLVLVKGSSSDKFRTVTFLENDEEQAKTYFNTLATLLDSDFMKYYV